MLYVRKRDREKFKREIPTDPFAPVFLARHVDFVEPSFVAKELSEACKHLSEKQSQIIQLLYNESLTTTEAAEFLGVTPSRVTQLHLEALRRLRLLCKRLT